MWEDRNYKFACLLRGRGFKMNHLGICKWNLQIRKLEIHICYFMFGGSLV